MLDCWFGSSPDTDGDFSIARWIEEQKGHPRAAEAATSATVNFTSQAGLRTLTSATNEQAVAVDFSGKRQKPQFWVAFVSPETLGSNGLLVNRLN